MNRGTVVFLALAILLAHTFAIHQTPEEAIAPPYEMAHVAYRLGRNLVFEGSAQWNPGGPAVESYPSIAWVLVSAFAARIYASPILVTQGLGLLAGLSAVIALAQFSRKRAAGLIAPLLLATSGSAAAALLSGTEAALAMLLVVTAFLAFERGWAKTLALALALLVLTRPEGTAILGVLMVLEAWARPRGEHARRPARWGAYALPLVLLAALSIGRRLVTGGWLSPFAAPLVVPDPERWQLGAQYLAGFAVSSGAGLLLLVVVLSLCAGRASALGARALAVGGAWWGVVALSGGDELPFWSALVPGLPLVFLGVQECLREWMDDAPALARAVWPLLFVSVAASLLVSKVPGDLGPLALEAPLTAWQTPRGELGRAYPRKLGRLGLLEEFRAVEHLRALGVFLRSRVGADASILTTWPGALGYLSRKEVLDLSGRAWPLPGDRRPFSWRGVTRVDVVATLQEARVDYVVPLIGSLSVTDAPADFLRGWLARYDVVGSSEERVRELVRALSGFMLVSVPVPDESQDPAVFSGRPFPLLQRRELELIPTLSLETTEGVLRVFARHEGHQLVADLCVRATQKDDSESYLRPTGSWVRREPRSGEGGPVDARTSLLVFPTGQRAVLLIEARVPAELAGARVTAWLHNPGMRADALLSPVGSQAIAELR